VANITTYELFVGDINIPNINPGQDDAEAFELFVTKHEQKLLSDVLGYQLAKDTLTAFADEETDGIYFDIWNGKDYTDKFGRANNWPGFLTVGYSPIAYYIFCKWTEHTATYTTSNGEKKSNSANASNVYNGFKSSAAWNEMVELLYILDDFCSQKGTTGAQAGVKIYEDYESNTVGNSLFTKSNVLGI
jgi:hypothetical protein